MALYLSIMPLKTCSGLEPVPLADDIATAPSVQSVPHTPVHVDLSPVRGRSLSH